MCAVFTENITIEVSIDTDQDGIYDAVDIDDENDGVPDTEEIVCASFNAGINEIATLNGNGSGMHTASATYPIEDDSVHFILDLAANAYYFCINDGFAGQSFD